MNQLFCYTNLEYLRSLLAHHRTTEIIALSFCATVVPEEVELSPCFDPFSDHSLLKACADSDHGADDGRISWVRSDVMHERLMEFQRVRRETPQISKARIASPEVINKQLDAHSFQFRQCYHGGFRVMH